MNGEIEGKNVNGGQGALTAVADIIGDLVTGIPSPVRKNALKAFAQLCTAAVDYPMSLISNASAERRAESEARIKLINTSVDQIAQQMQTDPKYALAAASKFASKIIRERVNVDQVFAGAIADLKSVPHVIDDQVEEVPPISDDWLNAFENEAAQMSSEQMQRLFSKILAGEIRRPSSYSIKTVKLMAQLDNQAAALFSLLCSLSLSIRTPKSGIVLDARVVSLSGNASSNSLRPHGLGFEQLNILQENGLIISDYDSYADYQMPLLPQGQGIVSMTYQNALWLLVPTGPVPVPKEVRMYGVAFSSVGRELLSIVDIATNDVYTSELKNFFSQKNLSMVPLDNAGL